MKTNKYHIYIPSHNRSKVCKSAEACMREGLDFTIVVEPSQYKDYCKVFPKERIYVLSKDGKGIAYKRNKIVKLAKQRGHKAHWQIDDKVGKFYRRNSENKIVAIPMWKLISKIEKEFDAYTDLKVHGPGVTAFACKYKNAISYSAFPYSCWLQKTENMPKFRAETLDDVDYALQILSRGECITRSNVYLRNTCPLGKVKGGNTAASKKDVDRMNERLAITVKYFPDAIEIKPTPNKEGILFLKHKKRMSLLFPQRPTLKRGK